MATLRVYGGILLLFDAAVSYLGLRYVCGRKKKPEMVVFSAFRRIKQKTLSFIWSSRPCSFIQRFFS